MRGLADTYNIDFTQESYDVAYHTSDAVAAANAISAYGYSDWEINQFKDILGKKLTDDSVAEPSKGDKSYSIIGLKDNEYCAGDLTTGDGSSEDKRPKALETNLCLTKQE